MKYYIWKIRKALSRLFYKKYCVMIEYPNGFYRTQEIDLDKVNIRIDSKFRVTIVNK